jgi:hypothetical protein
MPEGEGGEGKVDWSRGPRRANLAKVSIHKLDRAARERGIRVDIERRSQGKVTARVSKTVVRDMPAPRSFWGGLFKKRG